MINLIGSSRERDETLSIRCICRVLSTSRATFYRCGSLIGPVDGETDLRDAIQWIALEMPCYGYRRITKELHRRGWNVNHKHVLRLMRQDNLLCLRKKKYITTTDSQHGLRVYPNLVPDLVVDDINVLWVADITYIRLAREFVYLAVVLDAHSRRCVGWNLSRRLNDDLAIDALKMALDGRELQPDLVHHSDRGVQYASGDYTQLLKDNSIAISMSRGGNPYDNAKAESFMKTLKYEEVYLSEYENKDDARASIEYFIEEVYNLKRLHSSIGYLPPVEFEQQLEQLKKAVTP
jgi:putative transposase